jgi:tetratricopeptide (TPR) repeat protein
MNKKVSGLILLIIGLFAAYSLYKGNMVTGIIILVVVLLVGLYLLGISDEKKESGNEEVIVNDKKSYGHILKDGDLDFEQAKKTREQYLKNAEQVGSSLDINDAAGLMLNKDYTGAIAAYESIMEKYPEEKGVCLGQIGAAEYFLGNYETSLERYIEAKNSGEDNDMMEDNIWEACETIHKEKGSSAGVERYISLYPQGRYIKKAIKLLP